MLIEIYAESLVDSQHLKLLPIKRTGVNVWECVCVCVYVVATHLLSIWYLDWDQIEDC